MTGIVEFLTARLDEREAILTDPGVPGHHATQTLDNTGSPVSPRVVYFDKREALADLATKRQTIELHTGAHTCREIHTGTYSADWPKEAPYGAPGQPWRHAQEEYFEDEPCPTLRLLALPYADDPDYDQAWRAE